MVSVDDTAEEVVGAGGAVVVDVGGAVVEVAAASNDSAGTSSVTRSTALVHDAANNPIAATPPIHALPLTRQT